MLGHAASSADMNQTTNLLKQFLDHILSLYKKCKIYLAFTSLISLLLVLVQFLRQAHIFSTVCISPHPSGLHADREDWNRSYCRLAHHALSRVETLCRVLILSGLCSHLWFWRLGKLHHHSRPGGDWLEIASPSPPTQVIIWSCTWGLCMVFVDLMPNSAILNIIVT